MKIDRSEGDLISLVNRIKEGDEQAFDIVFLKYYNFLCRFAWRYVKSRTIAEELVQELFIWLWENRFSWEPAGSIRSYLYKSVKNRALDHLKHQKVIDNHMNLWKNTEEQVIIDFENLEYEEHLKKAIIRAVENLPERGRMVFKLHRYDGLTYNEIAQIMEISVKTVENLMARSFKLLRIELYPVYQLLSDAK